MSTQKFLIVAAFVVLTLGSPARGQLSVQVTTDTGLTEIINNSSMATAFDGYTIASPSGQLVGDWSSLASQGLSGWDEADSSNAQRRTEFNPTSASILSSGESLLLGNLFVESGAFDLAFQYTQPDGTTTSGNVAALSALVLDVDRGTGEVVLRNRTGGPVPIDGYTVVSPSGSLSVDNWQSLQSQTVAGWDEADNANNTRVTEFNPVGATSVEGRSSFSLGSLYRPLPAEIGTALPEDLTFTYATPSGRTLDGTIAYSGAINDVVLSIDPATGAGTIQNQSPFFDIAIDGYTITSASGNLNTSSWESLESQGLADWDAADNSDAFRITEFNPTSQTALPGGGTSLSLGAAFQVAGLSLDDLTFSYLVADGSAKPGVIVFAEGPSCSIPDGLQGDLDQNGAVEFADFLVLSGNFGTLVDTYAEGDVDCNGRVEFADFLVLSGNFGKTAGEVAAVPEPHAWTLIGYLAFGLLLRPARHRRGR